MSKQNKQPIMPVNKKQDTAFYVGKKALTYECTADGVSSDGGMILLKKLEQKHHLIRDFRLPSSMSWRPGMRWNMVWV